MTDYTKLIERLVKLPVNVQDWKAVCEIKEGIEALQGEVEQVKGFWKEAQLRNRNLLEESNDLAFLADQYKAERDALAARLDELQRQEPVAWTLTEELTKRETTTRAHLWFTDPVNCMWSPLYAAPKALEPLTDEQILEAIRNAPKIKTTYAGWVRDQRVAWGRAILAAAHGITKGTP